MKSLVCLIVNLMFSISASYQVHAQVSAENVWVEGESLRIKQSNTGVTAFNQPNGGLEWAEAPGVNYILGSGIWVGGEIDVNGNRVQRTFVTYDPMTAESWANPLSRVITKRDGQTVTATAEFDDADLATYPQGIDRAKAEGLPLGLRFTQTLTLNPLQDMPEVLLVRTVVTNVHPTRTIWGATIGIVVDGDIALKGTPPPASNLVTSVPSADLKIAKTSLAAYPNPSLYTMLDPRGAELHSFLGTSWFLTPFTHEDRYNVLASGQTRFEAEAGDVVLTMSTTPRDLPPGASLVLTAISVLSSGLQDKSDGDVIAIMKRVLATTTVDEEANNQHALYPNPTRGSDVVILPANVEISFAEIVDITGAVVARSVSPRALSIAHLSQGIYSVRMNTPTGTITKFLAVDR